VEWEKVAGQVRCRVAIVRYRAEHDLWQRDLAERLRMKQTQVGRLELGEVNPNIETLMRISAALGIDLTIEVLPA
jgi:transcriptional regulator with XRE-family HTH domain